MEKWDLDLKGNLKKLNIYTILEILSYILSIRIDRINDKGYFIKFDYFNKKYEVNLFYYGDIFDFYGRWGSIKCKKIYFLYKTAHIHIIYARYPPIGLKTFSFKETFSFIKRLSKKFNTCYIHINIDHDLITESDKKKILQNGYYTKKHSKYPFYFLKKNKMRRRRTFDYKKFFDLNKVPKESNFHPKINSYSCYLKLLNCPSGEWIINNIIGSLKKNTKKKSIFLIINERTVVIKYINLYISKSKIESTLSFLKGLCPNKKDLTEFINPYKCNKCKKNKKKDRCKKCKFKTVLNLNKLNIIEGQNSEKCFQFINDMYTLKRDPKNIKVIDKYFLNVKEKVLKERREDKKSKKELILKFNILKIDGEKQKKNILRCVEIFCNLINFKNNNIGIIASKNNLKITNLIYNIRIPMIFTKNLYIIKNNMKYSILGLDYKINNSTTNFPALIIKIFNMEKNNGDNGANEVNDNPTSDVIITNATTPPSKTTLEIFKSGHITLTGFKCDSKMRRIYPKLLYFLSLMISKTTNYEFSDFLNSFKNYNNDSTHQTIILSDEKTQKLEEKWKDEEPIFKQKGSNIMFRKSDLNDQKELFTKRLMSQHEVDLNNLRNNFYNESLNIFNFNNWGEYQILNWINHFKKRYIF